jgi:hypothetical protein
MRTLTDDYDGTFLGFYVVSFVKNLGDNSVTPSDVPETAQNLAPSKDTDQLFLSFQK